LLRHIFAVAWKTCGFPFIATAKTSFTAGTLGEMLAKQYLNIQYFYYINSKNNIDKYLYP
jgi:hypothetical protein